MKIFDSSIGKFIWSGVFLILSHIGLTQEIQKNQTNQSDIDCACTQSKFKVWNIGTEKEFRIYDCTCTSQIIDVKIFSRWGQTLATVNRFKIRRTDFEEEIEAGTYFLSVSYRFKEEDEPVTESLSLTILK